MNSVDQLLAIDPLFGISRDRLEEMPDSDERRQYVFDPKNGVIKALAELYELPNSSLAFESLIDKIVQAIPKVKTTLMTIIKKVVKDHKLGALSERTKDGFDVKQFDLAADMSLISNHKNIELAIKNTEEIMNVFSYDTFTHRVWITDKTPWDSGYTPPGPPMPYAYRELSDFDITKTCIWLNNYGIKQVTISEVSAIIYSVAKDNSFDYYKKMMDDLPVWDGKRRLNTWLFKYLKAYPERGKNRLIISKYGRKYLIAMMARCYEHQSIMRTVLVLEGSQELRKSAFLDALFSPFKTDHNGRKMDLGDSDVANHFVGIIGCEFPEFNGLGTLDLSIVKDFLSRPFDRYRKKFTREEILVYRRWVPAATINLEGDDTYLRDMTGNSRYWCVKCGIGAPKHWQIDIEAFKVIRPQLLAEAKHYYKSGEPWWLANGERELHEFEVSSRETDNPCLDHVLEYLEQHPGVFTGGLRVKDITDYFTATDRMADDRLPRGATKEIPKVLKKLGWIREKVFMTVEERQQLGLTSTQKRVWMYHGAKK